MSKENFLFPVFLKLHRLKILVVGGGYVGWEKLQSILQNSPQASIRLVAPEIREEILTLAAGTPNLRLIRRSFKEIDLQDIEVALLATDSREVNMKIRELAKRRNILVNVADTPDMCDFYLCSIVKKGPLKIGISTNGQSPTFAKRLKEVLQGALPDETYELLGNLKALRDRLKGDFQYKVDKLNQYTRSLVEDSSK